MNAYLLTTALALSGSNDSECRPYSLNLASVTSADERSGEPFQCDAHGLFTQACRFPLPRFDLFGNRIETTDCLVIYEGMKLDVCTATGQFRLRFMATTPDIQAVVRLQFHFKLSTLTIPPIKIVPDEANRGMGTTVNVELRGSSAVLKDVKYQKTSNGNQIPMSREGTCRFGASVAVDDVRR